MQQPDPMVRAQTVLDIACGDARLSAFAAAAGARFVVGVDLSHIGISAGRERWKQEQNTTFKRAAFIQGDGLKLPIAGNAFDIVIASEVIEHVDDPRWSLSSRRRGRSTLGGT